MVLFLLYFYNRSFFLFSFFFKIHISVDILHVKIVDSLLISISYIKESFMVYCITVVKLTVSKCMI